MGDETYRWVHRAYTSTHLYIFFARCLLKHKENFTVTYEGTGYSFYSTACKDKEITEVGNGIYNQMDEDAWRKDRVTNIHNEKLKLNYSNVNLNFINQHVTPLRLSSKVIIQKP